jgi:glutamate/tyrosine decarboxylase-like PLP-dependent enzyme
VAGDQNKRPSLSSRISPKVAANVERTLRRIPAVERRLEKRYAAMVDAMRPAVRPYTGTILAYAALPEDGRPRDEVLDELRAMAGREHARWEEGHVSGAVYHGASEHIEFMNQVYALNSQANPLHFDLWPSATKFEAEVVSMTAGMLGGDAAREHDATRPIVGAVTSGGTESILLAMKAYRDWARKRRGITEPNVVAPTTAHVAFDKASQYFGIDLRRVPVGSDYRADVEAMESAIDGNTVALVGSAPTFPHGAIDPIEPLADLARHRGIGRHTDACLGGFVLPFARTLGYPVPAFDFRVPGVTSMSADTHKFGYAAKGTSVVLYRGPKLRRYQYFTATEWPGGLYFSPTLAGSRPGALSAAAWAAMVSMGERGYLDASRRILEAAKVIRDGIAGTPGLHVLGDPLWIVAFGSADFSVYKILDVMSTRGWNLNGLHKPPAVHLCVTLRVAQDGVPERFVEDLGDAVRQVRADPKVKGGMAPVYGMAATVPFRGVVSDLLERYMDMLFEV